mmetsp:Transcript_56058/g.99823  ORF Transcript_56058/g.99823 Transcript_56058/m.99823 type:complete len:267 (-) Transcript_56058:221-1021(-)
MSIMDEGRPIFLSHVLLDGLMKRLDQQPGDEDACNLLRGQDLLNHIRQSRDVELEEWSDYQSYQPYLPDRRPPVRPSSARRRFGPNVPGPRDVYQRAEDEPKRPNTARETLHRMRSENAQRMRRQHRGVSKRRMEAEAVLAAIRHRQEAARDRAKVNRMNEDSELQRKQEAALHGESKQSRSYAGTRPHSVQAQVRPPKQVDKAQRRQKLQEVWEGALQAPEAPTLQKSSTGTAMPLRPTKPSEARPHRPARPMSAPLGGRGGAHR